MMIAIDQPNYIPWKGYFDLIHDVDLFVFYNDVQYTTRDWRNRNIILTPAGGKWLTVPCGSNRDRLICDVKIEDPSWQRKHYDTIRYSYGKCPYFKKYKEFLEEVYLGKTWEYLWELDQYMTEHIAKDFLGIKTQFADSRDYHKTGAKHERLLSLLKSIDGADAYESGPAAKNYIIPDDYRKAGISLCWKDYNGYPEYPQQSEAFIHTVTILDLLFNAGDNSPYYIWGWREESGSRSFIWEAQDGCSD